MINKIATKLNVKQFRITDNALYIINTDNNLSCGDESIRLTFKPVDGFEIFIGKVYINDWNGSFQIFDLNLKTISSGEGKAFFRSSEELLGCQYIDKSGLLSEALISADKFIEVGNIAKFNNINLSNESYYFMLDAGQAIQCIYLPKKEPLWQYSLSKLKLAGNSKFPEIHHFVCFYQGNIWIYLCDNRLIKLNVENGNLIEQLTKLDALIGESSIGWPAKDIPFFESKYFLNPESGIIQALAIDLFYEIDIRSDKANAKAYSLKPEFEKYRIDPQHTSKANIIQNELLYFLDKKGSRFAILDTQSKKIVYISEPITVENKPHAYPQLKEIQVNESHVYVLASDHTLHIFKRV